MANHIKLDRAVISVSGEDSHKFLQGIISNDIGKVSAENSTYAFILTPQGKYLFDVFISLRDGKYYIEVFSSLKDELLKKLKMYKLRSKVEIVDEAELKVYSTEAQGYKDPRNDKMGCRLITKDELESGDISEYHKRRIENNIPEGEYDLERDKSYPLQYRMIELNAVDFKKGCYVGQEVTARTHHRGVVRKNVYKIEAAQPLERGKEIMVGEDKAGQVLSTYKNSALALIESEKVENSEHKFAAEGTEIKVFA